MKKSPYLILFLIFGSSFAHAQNYQCLRRDSTIYWYIDSINYLRAIRIDSVIASGPDTVYYPYHTIRQNPLTYISDTAGGSWVGKRVIQKADGTFLFDNAYSDTVIIKTQASLGDTWIFYSDSGNTFYKATVTSIDTMTVLGVIDSIKRVIINAYNSALDPTDFANNFTFILSKNHGFVQIFDLYNFPYHTPMSPTVDCYDAYFRAIEPPGSPSSNQMFNIIPFHPPTRLELYDLHPTDVVDYATYTFCQCGAVTDFEGNEYDSVLYRFDIDSVLANLVLFRAFYSSNYYCYILDSMRGYSYSERIDTLHLDNSMAINLNRLPEEGINTEWAYSPPNGPAYYYFQSDSSQCFSGGLLESTMIPFIFEGCENTTKYKYGLGVIDTDFCQYAGCGSTGFDGFTQKDIIYSIKNSVPCGTPVSSHIPNGVTSVLLPRNSFEVYPNPANNIITIRAAKTNSPYQIAIINAMGQTVRAFQTFTEQASIDVGNLPDGVYNFCIVPESGIMINKKAVIIH